MQNKAIINPLYFQGFMTFFTCYFCQVVLRNKRPQITGKLTQHGSGFMQVKTRYKSGKYAFSIMGHRRWVWDNKNAHVCPETAHSAIMRIDQHRGL